MVAAKLPQLYAAQAEGGLLEEQHMCGCTFTHVLSSLPITALSTELLPGRQSQPVLASGALSPQGQGLALVLAGFHEVPVGPFLQPA